MGIQEDKKWGGDGTWFDEQLPGGGRLSRSTVRPSIMARMPTLDKTRTSWTLPIHVRAIGYIRNLLDNARAAGNRDH